GVFQSVSQLASWAAFPLGMRLLLAGSWYAFFCCSRTGIVSTGFVTTVSPGRLPSTSQDRAPGYVARFVENQLHAPRAARRVSRIEARPCTGPPDGDGGSHPDRTSAHESLSECARCHAAGRT